jgi:regulator of protease activity HflC (stomatin/prohibitin superfamily)
MLKNKSGGTAANVFAAFVAIVVVVLVIGGVSFATAFKKTPQDEICVSYGGGPFEGENFQFVKQPGSGRFFNGLRDKLYCYPVTQRSYTITSRPGEGDTDFSDAIVAPSEDNISLTFELVIYFELNRDTVADFHRQIGIKTGAYDEDGWRQMLQEYFRPQIDQALQRQSRNFTAVEAYADASVFREIQGNLDAELPAAFAEAQDGEFFSNYRVVLRHIGVPEGVQAELEKNQESKIAIKTKQNEIEQRRAEAKAIEELNAALEKSGPSYVYLKCIEDDACQLPSFGPYLQSFSLGGGR